MYKTRLPWQQLKFAARSLLRRQRSAVTAANNLQSKLQENRKTKENSFDLGIWTNRSTTQRKYCTTRAEPEVSITPPLSEGETLSPATSEDQDEVDAEMANFSLKSLLYQDQDELRKLLDICDSYDQLQATIERHATAMQLHHRVQCILLLWVLCRQDNGGGTEAVFAKLRSHPVLEQVCSNLRPHVSEMDANELSCCYLYLRKIGVSNSHPVVQELLLQALQCVKKTAARRKTKPLPLPVLSRLVVGINTGRDFHIPSVCANFLPHLRAHLPLIKTAEEARLLAICLLNLQPLVDAEILETFKQRVHELLSTGIIGSHTSKAVLKLLHTLNLPTWSHRNAGLLRDLMLTLRECVPLLNSVEARTACRIYQHHLEPAAMATPLAEAAEKLLQLQPSPDALACFIPFAEPRHREALVALFKSLLTDPDAWQQPNASGHFFTALRSLKIADTRLCDAYWEGVMREVHASVEEETQLRFLRHCHRYMNFNNNLGGTYRYMPLERSLSQMAMRTIEGDLAGRIPVKFARLAAFVLAYGHTPLAWKKFPNVILSKVISMADQFSITDCFQLSRGLQIATEMRFRYHTPSLLGMQLSTFDSILISCAERHLSSTEPLNASDINSVVRTLGSRKSLKNTVTYRDALNKYKELDYSELNSRTIRDMAFNFNASNYFVPKTLDAMFEYVAKNREHVAGDTVEKVLAAAYNMGYTPSTPKALESAAEILMRDFNNMSGFSLVQSCLALCFYKCIPEDLINKIFCLKFIQRIEEEIQVCYSKATYPERVLNLVMQLNRTVCLDCPEANVPWFQQNYLEAQLSKKPVVQNRFSDEVRQLLKSVLKDDSYFRCNHTTPYGYQIDFVIHFDRVKQQPIHPEPAEITMLDRITKVAILLLKLDSFCENDLTALRGPESLKIKHLEMMGYKVLSINEHDWNSKYMNAPDAKANYLKCLLQISN